MLVISFKPKPLLCFYKEIADVEQGINMEDWELPGVRAKRKST